jgi:hypothetical protein
MSQQKFSVDEAIQFGWNVMKENLVFFILVMVIVSAIQITPGIITGLIEKKMPVLSMVISVISMLVNMVMGIGLIRIALKLCDTRSAEIHDLFSCDPGLFFKYFLSTMLYTLILLGVLGVLLVPVVVAVILSGGKPNFIIVGSLAAVLIPAGVIVVVWLALKLQFYSYLIIDRGLGPIGALNQSSVITRGAKGQLLIVWILTGLINIAGFILCFIGLFASIPITMMAMAFVYRRLLSLSETPTPSI